MRWQPSKKQLKMKGLFEQDHTEVVTKFLYLPRQIDGEWRWLEKVKVVRVAWVRSSMLRTVYHWLYTDWL